MAGIHYDAPLRDRIAVPVINFVFRLASPQYRRSVKGAIVYSIEAAMRDNAEDMPTRPASAWPKLLPGLDNLLESGMVRLDPGDRGYGA